VKLVATYAWFAALAIAANFGTQFVIDGWYFGELKIWLALIAGTGVGLVVKYFLDKKYIFRFETRSAGHDLKLMFGYAFFGLVTTTIFWGGELGFDAVFHNAPMRYFGGALGLGLGYYLKYQLDKCFVFKKVV